jgi:hypothetical protein
MTLHRAWLHAGNSGLSPASIIARLKNAVKIEITTGYQDETGFHTGVKATGKDIKWPSTW